MRLGFLLLCLAALPVSAADYLPLANGNIWTYRSAAGAEFTIRAGTPVFTNEQVYYSLSGYVAQRVLARNNENGELVYLDEDAGQEVPLTVFADTKGTSWDAPLRECKESGKREPRTSDYSGVAGNISGVVAIDYQILSCADAGVVSEQYAENIGMLKRVVTTFAGPVEYDLVYARVGKQVIESNPYARLAVVAVPSTTAGAVDVTFTLDVTVQNGIPLTFPTAQEYEVIATDSNGRELWNSATGNVYAQAFHNRTVFGPWRNKVSVPASALAGASEVWIHARLTTAPGTPAYAASTLVELEAPQGRAVVGRRQPAR